MNKFDYYGKSVKFFIYSNLTFTTNIGVCFTIISLLIILVACFLFGQDFYLRQNPRIYSENILSDSIRTTILNPKNFTFAFRFEDAFGNSMNKIFEEKLYFNITYNNIFTENDENSIENIINLTKCDNSLIERENFMKDNKNSDFYCLINSNGFNLGGSWTSDQIKFLSINISNCKRLGDCKDNKEIETFIKDNRPYISLYYPVFFFNPNNSNEPFSYRIFNYYSLLSHNFEKSDRIFFKSYFFQDDIGWIFQTLNNKEIIAFSHKESEYLLKESDELKDNHFNIYYSFTVYYLSDYEIYHRSYMKFQELTALVGGFMKIITFIFNILLFDYTTFEINKKLIPEIFDIDEKIYKNKRDSNTNNFVFKPSMKNVINMSNCSNRKLSKSEFEIKSMVLYNQLNMKNKFNFSFLNYISSYLKKRKSLEFKKYKLMEEHIKSRLDILSIIKNDTQIDNIKKIIFNKRQLTAFNYFQKIQYNHLNNTINYSIYDKKEDFIKFLNYYEKLKNEISTQSNIDNNIYNNLDLKIKEII